MLFNSIEFAVFLPIVFILYWFATNKNLKAQNILLLVASYFFYGWWDWRFLCLLFALSTLNYLIGIGLSERSSGRKRKLLLISGLVLDIGVLAVFKYFNFFIDSFADLVSLTGYKLHTSSLKIILPLGISFYSFLTISYIVDIYKNNLAAHKNIFEVLLTFGFFPIILAGPIQRPSLLLPQIRNRREFNYNLAVDGLRQILWGIFVKVVIADNLGFLVDDIFLNFHDYSGSTLLIGAIYYTIQIYADFSGYSNIAIGTARLLGFDLMRNFAYPYFSRDIAEFWKRWHISLTTWFRDYVFLPSMFSISLRLKSEKVLHIRADFFIYIIASGITWFLTGLWHGANYTFIIWGVIHGFFLIIYQLQKAPRKKVLKRIGLSNNNTTLIILESIITLCVVIISWVFFRASTVGQALEYISGIFSSSIFSIPEILPKKILPWIILFIICEWLQREKEHTLQFNNEFVPKSIRWIIYIGLLLIILGFGGGQQEFIYFQF